MYLTRLALTDFRNYEHLEVDFGPGVTAVLGANGQGKTNLIEALGYVATLGSHRSAGDAPLLRVGAASALIAAAVNRGGRVSTVEVQINPGRANRARVNRGAVPRQSDILGIVNRVLFAPEDLSLVKGDPSGRRGYLDELLVGLTPRIAGLRADLDRVLRQRNSLLKSAGSLRSRGSSARRAAEDTLGVWDDQFLNLAAALVHARLELIGKLREPLVRNYQAVAPASQDQGVTCAYVSATAGMDEGANLEALRGALAEHLGKRRDEEFQRGLTLVGPHRDDLALGLRGMAVRGYASHGECWSMALSLRLASYDIVQAQSGVGGEPILVLDDVFAELDEHRRGALAELVGQAEQVLVTAAVESDVPGQLQAATLRIRGGRLADVS